MGIMLAEDASFFVLTQEVADWNQEFTRLSSGFGTKQLRENKKRFGVDISIMWEVIKDYIFPILKELSGLSANKLGSKMCEDCIY
jgi:hypothetical protein